LAQPEFAAQIGISRGRLSNYEYLKTPLPCDLALKTCHQFIIGERWLATGKGSMRQFIHLARWIRDPMNYRKPFGEVYDAHLSIAADEQARALDFLRPGAFILAEEDTSGSVNESFYKNYVNMLLDRWLELLRAKGRQQDFGKMVKALADSGFSLLHHTLEGGFTSPPPQTKQKDSVQ
jgi:hypothetical protein